MPPESLVPPGVGPSVGPRGDDRVPGTSPALADARHPEERGPYGAAHPSVSTDKTAVSCMYESLLEVNT